MATLFVRHDVSDFEKWKQAYDAFDGERQKMGVTDHGVFRDRDNPNNVTVYHDFETMQAAEDFVANPHLLEVLRDGGVVGPPSLWYTNKV